MGGGGAYEREAKKNYSLLPKLTVSSSPASPTRVRTPITFTGSADPTSRPWEYRFMLRGPATNGLWVLMRDYATSPDWTWTPPAGKAGVHKVKVRVREPGSGVIAETETITPHTVSP